MAGPGSLPHARNGSHSIGPQMMLGYVDPDYLYGVFITLDAGAVAYRYRISTGALETIDLSTVASNQLELPLFAPADDHYALAIGVYPKSFDGSADHLVIVGNHHDDNDGPPTKWHCVKCTDVSDFTNAASWSAGPEPGSGLDSDTLGTYTYHLFERLSDGTLLWFSSQSETGADSKGRDWIAHKRTPAAGWTAVVDDGHFATTEPTDTDPLEPDPEADRVYISGLYVEGPNFPNPDRVWVVGLWRTDNVVASSQQAPFVLYSDNLSDWFAVDGTAMSSPGPGKGIIWWSTRDDAEVDPTVASDYCLGICIDPDTGYPSFIVRDGTNTAEFRWAWNGATWASTDTGFDSSNDIRELWWRGQRWIRRVGGSGQLTLRTPDGSHLKTVGGRASGGESLNWCPILLREQEIFAVCIGDGDTPRIYMLGNGAKSNA